MAGAFALLAVFAVLTWRRCGVWKDGLTLWSDVLDQFPDNTTALYNRGCYLVKTGGNFDGAIRDLSKAITLNPRNDDAYNNRGIAYMAKKRYDLALADFDKSLVIKPDNVKILNNRGTLNLRMGRIENAFRDYDAALRISPGYAEIYLFRGNAFVEMARYGNAIADYTRAIGLKSGLLDAYNMRAISYYRTGQFDKAAADVAAIRRAGADVNQDFLSHLKAAMGN
jgi:tetratricopeptide (TPR) repeat protein